MTMRTSIFKMGFGYISTGFCLTTDPPSVRSAVMKEPNPSQRLFPFILTFAFIFTATFSTIPISGGQDSLPPAGTMISSDVSFRFVQGSQNIHQNEFNYLRDIYYYVGLLNITGELHGLSNSTVLNLINAVQGFQNSDGGFGDWYRDRSKSSSTRIALETLKLLGASPLNKSKVVSFINRLQVSGLAYGNFGFRSSVKDRDADVSSTYDAISSLRMLYTDIPHSQEVIDYLRDHQNEDGGFGYQTVRSAGVHWASTSIHTFRGLLGLKYVNGTPDFTAEAIEFLKGLQTTEGGFSNTPNTPAQISYTYDVVVALQALGEPVPRENDIVDFITNNHIPGAGFLENALDNKVGIHTAYYAVKTMDLLGSSFDRSEVLRDAANFLALRLDNGFGNYPGQGSTIINTFDAISVLNLIGRTPVDSQAAVQFTSNYYNDDGGYGHNSISDIETTFRCVMTLQLLGNPLPDPERTVSYIRTSQNSDGGFGFGKEYVSRGSYTYRAIRTLDILGYRPLNREGAIKYLQSLQNPDGGFGNYYGEADSDLGSTYRAIRALHILEAGPANPDGAEDFILRAQNPDGGFKRSPSETSAPLNFSRSIFTYDAVLGLHFLGRPIRDWQPVYNYTESLRNPDLGFGDQPFHSSTVASTFTALWTLYYLLPDVFNHAPRLAGADVSPQTGDSATMFNFTVQYDDVDEQSPEFVRLDIDGFVHIMRPLAGTSQIYSIVLPLHVGNHTFTMSTFDGLLGAKTSEKTVRVDPIGNAPEMVFTVDPEEGTEEIDYLYSVTYSDLDFDPAFYIMICIDSGPWIAMEKSIAGNYIYSTSLVPGNHSARAKTSDGHNIVITPLLELPVVFPQNSSRPDWETFLRIQRVIEDNYGVHILYSDVERDIYKEELVWKVFVGDDFVYVSYDGTRIIGSEENSPINGSTFLIVLIVIMILVATVILLKRKR